MPRGAQKNKSLQRTQAQVDEVVDIMKDNVDKVVQRGQKVEELDKRAEALRTGASTFQDNTGKVKRKYWWKNCRMWVILIGVVVGVMIIVIVAVLVATSTGGGGSGGKTASAVKSSDDDSNNNNNNNNKGGGR